ncbi:hypothetical protein ACLOJK_027379 [Asimina triloba]
MPITMVVAAMVDRGWTGCFLGKRMGSAEIGADGPVDRTLDSLKMQLGTAKRSASLPDFVTANRCRLPRLGSSGRQSWVAYRWIKF